MIRRIVSLTGEEVEGLFIGTRIIVGTESDTIRNWGKQSNKGVLDLRWNPVVVA